MRVFLFTLIGMVALASSSKAAPVRDTSLKAQLEMISKEMFEKGQIEFLLVEALRDSLINADEPYFFQYSRTGIIVNGVKPKKGIQEKYVNLLKELRRKNMVNIYKTTDEGPMRETVISVTGGEGSLRGDPLTLGKVLNPYSSFRNRTSRPVGRQVTSNDVIVEEMIKDGLVDTANAIHITYSIEGVFANGVRLEKDMEAKYKELIQYVTEFEPKKAGDVFSVER